jgi:hypothetical protein
VGSSPTARTRPSLAKPEDADWNTPRYPSDRTARVSLISPAYLEQIFTRRDEESLAWLSSAICGTASFHQRHPTYGLVRSLFLFVEDLLWFAQSSRSGSWTYFEATAHERQQAMLEELRTQAPPNWSDQYAFGMDHWQDSERLAVLDAWIDEQDRANSEFLWKHLARHRPTLEAVLG